MYNGTRKMTLMRKKEEMAKFPPVELKHLKIIEYIQRGEEGAREAFEKKEGLTNMSTARRSGEKRWGVENRNWFCKLCLFLQWNFNLDSNAEMIAMMLSRRLEYTST